MKPQLKNMLLFLLSFLLHHANRLGRDHYFYKVKKKLLEKYGTPDGYDIQIIDGKPCFSCHGTGIYNRFMDGACDCDRCGGNGYYKDPFFVQLNRYNLGDFSFHVPGDKQYCKTPSPELLSGANKSISYYITHMEPARYAQVCKLVLILLYDRKNFFSAAIPYHLRDKIINPGYWDTGLLKPSHLALNIFHVIIWGIRTRGKNVPLLKRLKDKWAIQRSYKLKAMVETDSEELPF